MKNLLHKFSIKTLKLFLRFMYRTHRVFAGVGVAMVTAALVVGFFMLIWWGIGAVKSAIESGLERALVERLLTLIASQPSVPERPYVPASPNILETPAIRQFLPPSVNAGLVSGSFSDLFSGVGWLDVGETTMYQDSVATAFMFEPAFDLAEVIGVEVDFSGNTGDEIGLKGTVVKRGDVYKGLVSRSDGAVIFDESNTPFASQYPGKFGFGGDRGDWIAVYGAYNGIAFRVRDGSPANISRLFGNRIMDGGFRPAIFRVVDYSGWYVWDADGEKTRFIKLFEDASGNIVGVSNLSDKIMEKIGGDARKIEAGVSGSDIFIRAAFSDGSKKTFRFIDKGFLVPASPAVIRSANLNGKRDANVWKARISRVDIGGDSASFYLANKSGEWIPTEVGKWVDFAEKNSPDLFWAAQFPSPSGSAPSLGKVFHGPFFDFIQIEYFLKF